MKDGTRRYLFTLIFGISLAFVTLQIQFQLLFGIINLGNYAYTLTKLTKVLVLVFTC